MSEVLLPTGTAGWMVRPRLSRSTLFRLLLAPAVFLVEALYFALNHVFGPFMLEAPLALLGAALIGLYWRNSRFMADRSSVSRIDAWGRTRSWPLSSIDRVDRFTLRARSTAIPYMAFMGDDGKALLTLTGQYWDAAQVEEICNRVGLRLTGSFGETVSVFELSRRLGRKQQKVMFLYAVFVVLGAAAAALVFVLLTHGH